MNTLGKAGLMAATFFLSLSSQAQNRKVPPGAQSSLVSISPISMTANAGGLGGYEGDTREMGCPN